jgi:hypothetical protein
LKGIFCFRTFKDKGRAAMMKFRLTILILAGLLVLNMEGVAKVAVANDTLKQLAKQEQNPLARLIRLQFEDNAQFGFGPDNELLNFLRIQPIIPFDLNERWSLITRTVIPIVHQPWPESADGLSDIALQFLLSPSRKGKHIWGIGPGFFIPTATDEIIGTEKWSAGPVAASIYTSGPWVVGAVFSHVWSFAGDDERRDVSITVIRPIVNHNLPGGWYVSSSPSIIADWEADRENRWLVPLGGGVGKIFAIGTKQVSALLEAYYHVESPEFGPDWQLRFRITFLFPE